MPIAIYTVFGKYKECWEHRWNFLPATANFYEVDLHQIWYSFYSFFLIWCKSFLAVPEVWYGGGENGSMVGALKMDEREEEYEREKAYPCLDHFV